MKGESIRSICSRTRHDLIGNGDAIHVYLTADGGLHSHYTSAGCIYVDHSEDVIVVGYFTKPIKMEALRHKVLNCIEGRGAY